MRVIIISGYSGSGKSVALNTLEDEGYYCVDNIPASLLPELIERVTLSEHRRHYNGFAIGVDARADPEELRALPETVVRLRKQQHNVRILFLRAIDDVLLRRFSETRRKHPLTYLDSSLAEAIHSETVLLDDVARSADLIIDTSALTLHELRRDLRLRLLDGANKRMSILVQSFGFKHGSPTDSDFVFDVRCLPNPHWHAHLRAQTGKDPDVINFLEAESSVRQMIDSIKTFMFQHLEAFAENRAYLTVSIGCTGGKHRSVYVAEQLFLAFKGIHDSVHVRHRDSKFHTPSNTHSEARA